VFVLVSTKWVVTCHAIDNPNSGEIRTFFTKNMTAVEIHHELCVVYSQTVMNE
jgi:hypothetical protein